MNRHTLSDTTFGLIGHPLGHSFSREFFTELFAGDGSGRSYDNFDLQTLDPASLYSLLLLNPRLKGLNVTIPYKEAIIDYLDSVEGVAKTIGAVNTVRVERADDGRILALRGFNTDVEGFRESIRPLLDGLECRPALVLGTGGASKAVIEGLKQLGHASLSVSRSLSDDKTLLYTDLDASIMTEHPIVVNCTPAGTFPNTDTFPPIPYELLPADALCFDLVYNPAETQFMRRAAAQGARVSNGLDMLHRQAMASLAIWES